MQVKSDLVTAFKARLPGIHLRTIEENRAMDALREAVRVANVDVDVPRALWRWSSPTGSGLWSLGLEEEPVDKALKELCAFDQALAAFQKMDPKKERVVLALMDPWDALSQATNQRHLRESLAVARDKGCAIVIVGKDWKIPVELQADIYMCDLPLPSLVELTSFIESLVELFGSNAALKEKTKLDKGCIPDLARACTGLTFHETRSVASLSLVRHKAIGAESVQMAIREKKQIISRTGMLEYEEPTYGMDSVGGLPRLKNWLSDRTNLFSKKARERGIKCPRGILTIGVPGAGKTLIARAISTMWKLPLVKLDFGKIYGPYVGESDANFRMIQRNVEAVSPCVLFMDEIDKGLGNGAGGDAGTSSRILGSFLSWMQDTPFEIFFNATANYPERIDAAIMRRFDAVFAVDLPDLEARIEILNIHLKKAGHKFDRNVLLQLAEGCGDCTGAEIERGVQSALIAAFKANDRKLTKEDVKAGLKAVVPIVKTMPEVISKMREFCKNGRAIPAGDSIELDEAKNRKNSAAGVEL